MSGRCPSANSMSTTGPITWTTLPTFCLAATSVAISAPLLRCALRARHHLDDFAGDCGLSHLVHVEGKVVDDLTRVLTGRVHGRHARGMFGRYGFQQRPVYLDFNVPRQQLRKNRRGLGLE